MSPRSLVEDEFDRLGVYATRQRVVQPASTNRPSHSHTTRVWPALRLDERVQAHTGLHVTIHTITRPDRSVSVTPTLVLTDGSIPSVGVEAARAARQHPYPSRTRKLSSPACQQVLEWATLWERWFAATHSYSYSHTFILHSGATALGRVCRVQVGSTPPERQRSPVTQSFRRDRSFAFRRTA